MGDLLNVVGMKKDIIVYSFDVNLGSDLIEKLKLKYGIEQSPTILIDESVKVTEFDSIDDILKYLN